MRRSENIDRFCSGSHWILPAARFLHGSPNAAIAEDDDCWVVLGGTTNLYPLEAMWGLACPLIGSEPEAVVGLLLDLLTRVPWNGLLLTGVAPGSPLHRTLQARLGPRYPVSTGPATRRYVADIGGGLDGFLSRRSRDFQRNLRRAERLAAVNGLQFEVADDLAPEESFRRILDVERRSWKGARRVGIDTQPMSSFYEEMNRRLAARGLRRLSFARVEGQDVAYILGGVVGRTYRGLQFSFDRRYEALSLGNLCQVEEIRRLAGVGIDRYDLGTEVSYKKRWADALSTTISLIVRRNPAGGQS
ncbi:MAG TPA: GNAT family N-acetyltransferase [Vicinamibacteria bacterium]|nr:GNAT family N-acetyltransferase [Vicinamibacteria bacterium]